MSAGNPHYTPVYEDYARDSPYPYLISGENYDWLTNRPWPGQHEAEVIGRPIHNVLTALRPAAQLVVALGQVGHTYFLTAEQYQREQAAKAALREKARLPPLIDRPKRSKSVTRRRAHARSIEKSADYLGIMDQIKRSDDPRNWPHMDSTGIDVVDDPIIPQPSARLTTDQLKREKRALDLKVNAFMRSARKTAVPTRPDNVASPPNPAAIIANKEKAAPATPAANLGKKQSKTARRKNL